MEISKLSGQMNAANSQGRKKGTSDTSLDSIQGVQDTQVSLDQQNEGERHESLSERLRDITGELNQHMDYLNTNVRFYFSDEISSMYITVTERNTGKEIRQIPTDEAIRLTKYFRDAIGLIFDKES